MKQAENHVCPRCGGGVPNDSTPGAYPGALSRFDNETEICSACGTEEAMILFARTRGGNLLDPVTGVRPWVKS